MALRSRPLAPLPFAPRAGPLRKALLLGEAPLERPNPGVLTTEAVDPEPSKLLHKPAKGAASGASAAARLRFSLHMDSIIDLCADSPERDEQQRRKRRRVAAGFAPPLNAEVVALSNGEDGSEAADEGYVREARAGGGAAAPAAGGCAGWSEERGALERR